MRYKVGDRVRIKSIDWYNENKNEYGNVNCSLYVFSATMRQYCGTIRTIRRVDNFDKMYKMEEDGCFFDWTDEMIEGLVEEETKPHNNMCKQLIDEMNPNVEVNVKTKPEPKFKRGDFVFSGIDFCAMKVIDRCYDEHWRYRIFDDVNEYWLFEKELKKVEIGDVVYSKVWKEKVIVRDFCDDKFILVADFNGKLLKSLPSLIKQIKEETKPIDFTIKATDTKGKVEVVIPDGYSYVIENDKLYFITEKKDVTYPKTYEECCRVLGVSEFEYNHIGTKMWYRHKLMATLDNLMLCRDAYWKIAGEEMGLGKPWEPIFDIDNNHFVITVHHGEIEKFFGYTPHDILVFPTVEMRDAFYENFKEEIENCKELL